MICCVDRNDACMGKVLELLANLRSDRGTLKENSIIVAWNGGLIRYSTARGVGNARVLEQHNLHLVMSHP